MVTLSGPAFEPAKTELFKSVYDKVGAHYNIFGSSNTNGMDALRCIFPEGVADDLNFCLFSTSGVHGTYQSIEDCEDFVLRGLGDGHDQVTFLIVHSRLVCLRHGNCEPKTAEDFDYLKGLRESSWQAMMKIGG